MWRSGGGPARSTAAWSCGLDHTRHPGIAAEFFDDFNDPQGFWPRIEDLGAAKRYVAEKTGAPWFKTAAMARAAIAGGQVKRKLGIAGRL